MKGRERVGTGQQTPSPPAHQPQVAPSVQRRSLADARPLLDAVQ